MFLQSYIGPVWSVPAILQTSDVHGPMNEDVPVVELCTLYLLACQVRVTEGDCGLFVGLYDVFLVCMTSFER